ncbi:WXG100-like domain-containing protein [Actinoalloteichus hymeniacidonis]|uniref:Outer membrane channel protein CpnT-like N-terminal domain-containing protein n=1 Tax=Actinoalloteichus hymeniacidonis TaxID=340345 RepID=A0AAC9HMM9_9PSEU|nr:hypothetical protein [Actinoalloteichus hymeniacidonis]AOS62142.1 hypothetical protein TL08_06590 [Actinoalloteichus hymeniacidonis]MBB5909836.1 hypothetical protein [Actinoalloteichus hymeniacidonis]
MGIEIPEWVQWLTPIVVGASWPEGDETALRRLGEGWEACGTEVGEVADVAEAAGQAALATMEGATADAFREFWGQYVVNDPQFLPKLQELCTELGAACDNAALEVEYTKLSIIAALVMLAASIASMVAAAFATFGTSTAGIPIAQAATRVTVQMLFRQLIQQIALNLAVNIGVDVAIQSGQMLAGNRTSWDGGKTLSAGITGLASGIAGGLGGTFLPSGATNGFADAAVQGATNGMITGAGANLLDRGMNDIRNGELSSFGDYLQSGAQGATVGGTNGAVTGANGHAQNLYDGTINPSGNRPPDTLPPNYPVSPGDYNDQQFSTQPTPGAIPSFGPPGTGNPTMPEMQNDGNPVPMPEYQPPSEQSGTQQV